MPPTIKGIYDPSEFETRKEKIDVLLREQGWLANDRSKVILEVDTKQSNFRTQNYKMVSETLSNELETKFADYLLLDGKGDIPDVIERYKKRREESSTDRKGKCFFVPYNEIKENGYDLSISKYREIVYEKVEYEKPEVILTKIDELEDQIKANVAELRRLLEQAQ